jgi:hypothetical protein
MGNKLRIVLGATNLLPLPIGHQAFVVGKESITYQTFPNITEGPELFWNLAIIRLPYTVNKSSKKKLYFKILMLLFKCVI